MATAFIEAVKRANRQFQLTDATTTAQQAAKLSEFQNMLRYAGENPALFDYAVVNLLGNAQVGNGATTNYLDSGFPSTYVGPPAGVLIRIVTTIGATPTCTYQIQGSPDHSTWSAVPAADSATPATFSSGTFVVTTAGTKFMFIKPGTTFQFFQITYSLNTNVTNTADAIVF